MRWQMTIILVMTGLAPRTKDFADNSTSMGSWGKITRNIQTLVSLEGELPMLSCQTIILLLFWFVSCLLGSVYSGGNWLLLSFPPCIMTDYKDAWEKKYLHKASIYCYFNPYILCCVCKKSNVFYINGY